MTQKTISAIVSHQDKLEALIEELIKTTASRHEISVQGSADQMNKAFGAPYVNPNRIQHGKKAPQREPFLKDDSGWILGYSFAIPLAVGVIIGVFLIGDFNSTTDNILYGSLGGFIGAILGAIFAFSIKKRWDNAIRKQESKGGFVVWIHLSAHDNMEDILKVLRKHNATHIETSDTPPSQTS